MNQADTPVIELKNVHKRFEQRPDLAQRILALAGRPIDRRTVYAVNGVDLSIRRGEVVGLVGESGCGKSTLGRVVAGLHRQTEGELLYQGRDAARLRGADKLAYTLGVQMIFQDPQASLNPRQRLRQILGEALKVHKLAPPPTFPRASTRRCPRSVWTANTAIVSRTRSPAASASASASPAR